MAAARSRSKRSGSDLNPVAVLISKALAEIPPKFAGLPPVNPKARTELACGGAWQGRGAQGLAEAMFARQLDDARFEAFLSFIQSLTEAAKMVPRVLVIGSLPESSAEAGGARGGMALLRVEKEFGRVQSPWIPTSGDETHSIVLRRGNSLIQLRKFFLRTAKHRPGDPSEIRALDFKYEFRRYAIFSLSVTIGVNRFDSAHPTDNPAIGLSG